MRTVRRFGWRNWGGARPGNASVCLTKVFSAERQGSIGPSSPDRLGGQRRGGQFPTPVVDIARGHPALDAPQDRGCLVIAKVHIGAFQKSYIKYNILTGCAFNRRSILKTGGRAMIFSMCWPIGSGDSIKSRQPVSTTEAGISYFALASSWLIVMPPDF